MKKSMIGLAATGLLALSAVAQQQPAQITRKPAAPALFNTVYGDVAKVLSAKPVPESLAYLRRECRIDGGTSNTAPELPRCDSMAPPGSGDGPAGSGERIVAYDVTYEYNGRQFNLRMPYDPGEQMPVNVDVRPPMPRPPTQQQQRPSGPAPQNPRYRGA